MNQNQIFFLHILHSYKKWSDVTQIIYICIYIYYVDLLLKLRNCSTDLTYEYILYELDLYFNRTYLLCATFYQNRIRDSKNIVFQKSDKYKYIIIRWTPISRLKLTSGQE